MCHRIVGMESHNILLVEWKPAGQERFIMVTGFIQCASLLILQMYKWYAGEYKNIVVHVPVVSAQALAHAV